MIWQWRRYPFFELGCYPEKPVGVHRFKTTSLIKSKADLFSSLQKSIRLAPWNMAIERRPDTKQMFGPAKPLQSRSALN